MRRQDTINNYIPKAMEAIEKVGIADENGIVEGVYEGYIASFGANIRQSGLLATLVFFNNDKKENKDKGKEGESSKWLRAILYILTGSTESNGVDLIKYVIDETKESEKNKYKQADLNFDKLQAIQGKIEDIVVALKLAVRTFKIVKDE